MMPLTQFQGKIRATELHESATFWLTLKLLFLSFHWDPNSVSKDFQVLSRTLFRKMEYIPAKILLFLTIGAIDENVKKR